MFLDSLYNPFIEKCYEQKLKFVLIAGHDHNGAFKRVKTELQKLYEGDRSFLVIDYVKDQPQDVVLTLTENLTGKIDKDTVIYIAAHGQVRNQRHVIFLSKPVHTSGLLRKIDQLTSDPIHVYIDACFGGAVNKDVDILKKGSTIITHTEPNEVTVSPGIFSTGGNNRYILEYINGFKQKEDFSLVTPEQRFLDNIQSYVSTSSFSISLGESKSYTYTFRPFQGGNICREETVQEFMAYKQQEFIDQYHRFVDASSNFRIPDSITDERAQIVLSDYFDLSFSVFDIQAKKEPHESLSLYKFFKDHNNREFIINNIDKIPSFMSRVLKLFVDIGYGNIEDIFKFTSGYQVKALEILGVANYELALQFTDYSQVKALEILGKSKDHIPLDLIKLALEFTDCTFETRDIIFSLYTKVEALEILIDINPRLALEFTHNEQLEALKILGTSNVDQALKLDYWPVEALGALGKDNVELALKFSNYKGWSLKEDLILLLQPYSLVNNFSCEKFNEIKDQLDHYDEKIAAIIVDYCNPQQVIAGENLHEVVDQSNVREL